MAARPLYGVNLPWLFGSYGHDLAPNELHLEWGSAFDGARAATPFREAASLGFEALRVWLCEKAEGVQTDGRGRVVGVRSELMRSLSVLQEAAAREGLLLYPTLLDGNSWKREGDPITHTAVSDPDACARFAEHVVTPIVRALDPKLTFALELLNEPEVMTHECAEPGDERVVPWEVLASSLRTLGDAARAALPGLAVTAGTMHVFLPSLWKAEPRLDAVDLHLYRADGALPPREQIAHYAGDARIASGEVPVFAGECGMPDELGPDEQHGLMNYLLAAERERYDAVFLWRLEGRLVAQTPGRELLPAAASVREGLRQLRARRGAGA